MSQYLKRRDDAINNPKQLAEVQRLMFEIIEPPCRRGVRGAALLLGWHPGTVHRIYKAKWNQIKIWPETAEAIRLAHDIAIRDADLTGQARELSERLAQQAGEFATTAAKLRRVLGKM